ncbi:acyl-CoA dehydratase activase [Chloroflexota bacterium]
MTRFMGVDIGSVTSKAVITADGKIEAFVIIPSGSNYRVVAEQLREDVLKKAGLQQDDIACITVTGHGTNQIDFGNRKVADMRCCARGINRLFPLVRTVIDVQGQSSQVLRVGENGQVINFVVSEKCASGSGRFLDIISNVLRVKLEDIGALSLESENPVVFTTGCAVFGESEAISRVAEGIPKEDILAGVHTALTDKIAALIDRVKLEEQCAISGGGALNIGLVKRLEDKLGTKLQIPEQPQLVNALGAAVMAEEEYKEK